MFGIAGQSNASGRGETDHDYVTAGLLGNDYLYQPLRDPTDSTTNQVDTVSIEPSLPPAGSVWGLVAEDIMAQTGTTAYFVPCAKGGSTISDWQPGADHQDRSTLYGSMVYRMLQAQAAGGTLKAVLWWQGEADTALTQAQYNAALDTVADAVMADLGVPLIPCKLQTCTAVDITDINLAIAEAWGDNANVVAGPDLSGITADNDDELGVHLISDAKIQSAASLWSSAIIAGLSL